MDLDRFHHALEFAAQRHHGQHYKFNDEHHQISHVYFVGAVLLSYGFSEDTVIAGMLHDIVEDTKTTIEEVRQAFGEEIFKVSSRVVTMPSQEVTWEFRQRGIIFVQADYQEGADNLVVTRVQYASLSTSDAEKLQAMKTKAKSSKFYGCPDALLSKDQEVFQENTCLESRSPLGMSFDGCSIQVSCHDFLELDTTAKDIGKELQTLLFRKHMQKLEAASLES